KGSERGLGSAYGIRTRVTDVRGRCPGPLDECATRTKTGEGEHSTKGRLKSRRSAGTGRKGILLAGAATPAVRNVVPFPWGSVSLRLVATIGSQTGKLHPKG